MRFPAKSLFLIITLFSPVLAGPLEDGWTAFYKKDFVTALRVWRPLAEQGDASAQFNLGIFYSYGHGVPQDYKQAVIWYRKAAEQGDAYAQSNLGFMYYSGQGVPQDYVVAHKWFNLAAAQGLADATKNRDNTASKMTPAQIAEAQKLAREWKPQPSR